MSQKLIDQETTAYQVALKMVDCIQDIKDHLNKQILSDYEIEAMTDIFNNCLTVDKSSDLDKNYLSNHKIIYCRACGSTKGCDDLK